MIMLRIRISLNWAKWIEDTRVNLLKTSQEKADAEEQSLLERLAFGLQESDPFRAHFENSNRPCRNDQLKSAGVR